jgi:hypothetical protein
MADMRGKINRTRLFGDLADYVEWVRSQGAQTEIVAVVATGMQGNDILVTYREAAPADARFLEGPELEAGSIR